MRIQLWSYNYDPEPTGIGPLSTVWAKAMSERGYHVEVVAAHPHYPTPKWGAAKMPYSETRDGIRVVRLPLWVGRATSRARLRQELSFTAVQALAAPFLSAPDVIVAVSPCFPALGPALVNAGLRRRPWVLWLQDILPDGAVATGILKPGRVLSAAARLEAMAYRSASRIVVISEACEANLRAKGVPPWKLKRIYNPSSRVGQTDFLSTANVQREQRLLCMGNIGHSQGLVQIVRAWEDSDAKTEAGTLVIVGAGVEAGEVADEIRSSTVQMLGLLTNEDLELELRRASLGVVTQRPDVAEFNLPSKLMNFMAYGLPVLAAVRPDSEVAGIIEGANAGWVVDSADPAALPRTGAEVLADVGELSRRGRNGEAFAARNFDPAGTAEQWDDVLDEAIGRTAAYASYALAR